MSNPPFCTAGCTRKTSSRRWLKILNPKVTMVWAVRASNLETHLDWAEKLTIWLQARLSRFATRITVNSMAGLEYAAEGGLPREKMMFVPNGIDTNIVLSQ